MERIWIFMKITEDTIYAGVNDHQVDVYKRQEEISLLPYTTEEAGGFVGCTIGMYASSNGMESKNHADFAWFTCSSRN